LKQKIKIKFFDILISAVLTTAGIAGIVYQTTGSPGGVAEVFFNDNVIESIDLQKNCDYYYNCAVSPVTISVKGGKIRVQESGCPLGICKKQGEIYRRGEVIVCAPNRLLIVVKEGKASAVQGVTG